VAARKQGWIVSRALAESEELNAALYSAMMLGRRYGTRTASRLVLGLSGGIDSALTAAVAVDALGARRVRCVMMPSR